VQLSRDSPRRFGKDYVIGYSGHENGIALSLAAAVMGAKVIERHFTLDRTMKVHTVASVSYHMLFVTSFSWAREYIRIMSQRNAIAWERLVISSRPLCIGQGGDHAASLEMGGLQRLVRDIHAFEGALGDGVKVMFPEEKPIFSKYEIPQTVEARG
jgi:hypothetical protein